MFSEKDIETLCFQHNFKLYKSTCKMHRFHIITIEHRWCGKHKSYPLPSQTKRGYIFKSLIHFFPLLFAGLFIDVIMKINKLVQLFQTIFQLNQRYCTIKCKFVINILNKFGKVSA